MLCYGTKGFGGCGAGIPFAPILPPVPPPSAVSFCTGIDSIVLTISGGSSLGLGPAKDHRPVKRPIEEGCHVDVGIAGLSLDAVRRFPLLSEFRA